MKKQATKEQLETTNKAYELREHSKNDDETAELFGMTKVTMYTRFRQHNWKKSEIYYIENLYNKIIKTNENENK